MRVGGGRRHEGEEGMEQSRQEGTDKQTDSVVAFLSQGRQEDAEEFLGYVLDGLHEELVAVCQEILDKGGSEEGTLRKTSEHHTTDVTALRHYAATKNSAFWHHCRALFECNLKHFDRYVTKLCAL